MTDKGKEMLEERDKQLYPVPPKYRDLFRRAYNGRSRKAAVRANCLECMSFNEKEVSVCSIPHCPLYLYRVGYAKQYEGVGSEIEDGAEGIDIPEDVENVCLPSNAGDEVEG